MSKPYNSVTGGRLAETAKIAPLAEIATAGKSAEIAHSPSLAEIATAGFLAGKLPFEPAENESNEAFESFLCYLDIGQSRSLPKVSKLCSIGLCTVRTWATRFFWRDRVRAYNIHLLRTRLAVDTSSRQKQAQIQSERTQIFQNIEWQVAEKLLRAAHHALDFLLHKKQEKIVLGDVARVLEIASRLGRLSTGLTTGTADHSSQVNVNLQLQIESAIKKVYGPIVDFLPPGDHKLAKDRLVPAGECTHPAVLDVPV